MGDWKLIKWYTPGKELELYNLKDDIGEQKNLAKDLPLMAGDPPPLAAPPPTGAPERSAMS